MSDAPAAARVGDPVTHSAALFGLLEGALVGAALGAILLASGGTAAPLVIAGAVASGASLGGAVGKFWGEHHVAPCGEILTGSPDVYVNGRPAAFVGSLVSCRQHPGPQTIVEGSGSVEINGRQSARVGDRCSCGCVIAPAGSPNVSTGGPPVMPEGAAAAEVPWYADAALLVLGLAGGGALLKAGGLGAAAIAAKLGASFFGSEVGGAGGRALGGRLFGEGSTGQAVLQVTGALVGGMGGDYAGGAAAGAGRGAAAGGAGAAERPLFAPKILKGTLEPGSVPGKPPVVDNTAPPLPDGWPASYDLSQPRALQALNSFEAAPRPDVLPEGTRMYRIIDAESNPNGGFWTLEPPPANEAEWRAGWAVKGEWNGDGAYVEHSVGADGLPVWRGPAGPQEANVAEWHLPGGREQIFVPPNTIQASPPVRTPWNP